MPNNNERIDSLNEKIALADEKLKILTPRIDLINYLLKNPNQIIGLKRCGAIREAELEFFKETLAETGLLPSLEMAEQVIYQNLLAEEKDFSIESNVVNFLEGHPLLAEMFLWNAFKHITIDCSQLSADALEKVKIIKDRLDHQIKMISALKEKDLEELRLRKEKKEIEDKLGSLASGDAVESGRMLLPNTKKELDELEEKKEAIDKLLERLAQDRAALPSEYVRSIWVEKSPDQKEESILIVIRELMKRLRSLRYDASMFEWRSIRLGRLLEANNKDCQEIFVSEVEFLKNLAYLAKQDGDRYLQRAPALTSGEVDEFKSYLMSLPESDKGILEIHNENILLRDSFILQVAQNQMKANSSGSADRKALYEKDSAVVGARLFLKLKQIRELVAKLDSELTRILALHKQYVERRKIHLEIEKIRSRNVQLARLATLSLSELDAFEKQECNVLRIMLREKKLLGLIDDEKSPVILEYLPEDLFLEWLQKRAENTIPIANLESRILVDLSNRIFNVQAETLYQLEPHFLFQAIAEQKRLLHDGASSVVRENAVNVTCKEYSSYLNKRLENLNARISKMPELNEHELASAVSHELPLCVAHSEIHNRGIVPNGVFSQKRGATFFSLNASGDCPSTPTSLRGSIPPFNSRS